LAFFSGAPNGATDLRRHWKLPKEKSMAQSAAPLRFPNGASMAQAMLSPTAISRAMAHPVAAVQP